MLRIVPKDNLTRLIIEERNTNASMDKIIERLTYIRPLKEWFMAGNSMTLDGCVEKCSKWSRRTNISWTISSSKTSIDITMEHVSFRYDWDEKIAHIKISDEAGRAIKWKNLEYTLKGNHCCDVEKVYQLNKHLEYTIELHDLAEWTISNGLYYRKKTEYELLSEIFKWWETTLSCSSMYYVKMASRSKLAARDEDCNTIAVRSWIDRDWYPSFAFCKMEEIDRHYADIFIPILYKRKQKYETYISYLHKPQDWKTKNYPTDVKPTHFWCMRGYEHVKEIGEEYRYMYDQLYDLSINLGGNEEYRFCLCSISIDLPPNMGKKNNMVVIRTHIACTDDNRFLLKCSPEELNVAFPSYLEELRDQALIAATKILQWYDDAISKIKLRIS